MAETLRHLYVLPILFDLEIHTSQYMDYIYVYMICMEFEQMKRCNVIY